MVCDRSTFFWQFMPAPIQCFLFLAQLILRLDSVLIVLYLDLNIFFVRSCLASSDAYKPIKKPLDRLIINSRQGGIGKASFGSKEKSRRKFLTVQSSLIDGFITRLLSKADKPARGHFCIDFQGVEKTFVILLKW